MERLGARISEAFIFTNNETSKQTNLFEMITLIDLWSVLFALWKLEGLWDNKFIGISVQWTVIDMT